MITRVRVQNFKCLEDVEATLCPLSVFIGPNDTGKTSFLEALWSCAVAQHTPARGPEKTWVRENESGERAERAEMHIDCEVSKAWRSLDKSDKHKLGQALGHVPGTDSVVFRAELTALHVHGKEYLTVSRLGTIGDPGSGQRYYLGPYRPIDAEEPVFSLGAVKSLLDALWRDLDTLTMYRFEPRSLARTTLVGQEAPKALAYDGYGLPSVLADLVSVHRDRFEMIESRMAKFVPWIKRINLPDVSLEHEETFTEKGRERTISMPRPGKAIEFLARGGRTVPIELASQGTVFLLGILTAAYGLSDSRILLLEEPENGMHPRRVREVVELLKKLVAEEGPDRRQIVLTTHSPYLLDAFEPEQVTIFNRDESGKIVTINGADVPDIKTDLKHFGMGELWTAEGEDQLIARARGSTSKNKGTGKSKGKGTRKGHTRASTGRR